MEEEITEKEKYYRRKENKVDEKNGNEAKNLRRTLTTNEDGILKDAETHEGKTMEEL